VIFLRKSMPIFFSALLLTGVNLLLRLVSTSFQVYLSGRIGAAGIGLLQLVLSVGSLSMTAGMAGIRTATMYLSAEEIGKKRSVTRVLSGCFLYSLLCSCTVGLIVWVSAPFLASNWIGHPETVSECFPLCKDNGYSLRQYSQCPYHCKFHRGPAGSHRFSHLH
jgi:O-antigen/teichoic acid export membrane protein